MLTSIMLLIFSVLHAQKPAQKITAAGDSFNLNTNEPERIITVAGDTLTVFVTEMSERTVSFRLQRSAASPVLHMPTRRIARLESERIGNHDFTYGNPRLKHKTGIALGTEFHDYYGPLVGASIDRFTPVGFRYYGYAGIGDHSIYDLRVGVFYHLDSRYNKSGFSPYVGISAGTDESEEFINASAGLMYNTPSGFFADAHLARRFNMPEDEYVFTLQRVFIGLRMGWRW